MALWILRAFFLLVAMGIGGTLASAQVDGEPMSQNVRVGIFLMFLIGSVVIIGADLAVKYKRIDIISSLYFGLLVGLFLTYIVGLALTPLFNNLVDTSKPDTLINPKVYQSVIMSFLGIAICYVCISVLWQTKDDFRFVIPYIEFSKDVKGLKPFVLDTSVVIDGRIADIVDTGIIDSQLVMPRFVLAELQGIADSSDKMRRSRGRRSFR